ncbi:ROK family transcriptional regulator [Paenibacillus sp. J2TS4]|uniref:ROK family transcriptional regulator n=1 Tax=Paenibacillus sp. J2TS4 TaxID=2807194 RepID=UPI001B24BA65|nr:ROK family transcriptional regulator [Paenibacillus sp. J2TS4]GIP33859.1 xylose repressor [Paenibacillus sp. J2TS4]
MKRTGDQHLVKEINRSIVLETIRRHSPLSRAQTSALTGLHKGTVSSLVNELIESGLVVEIGPGPSSGGRKPVLILFNKTAGYAVGVDLGVNYILTVLTDLEGNIVEEQSVRIADRSKDAVLTLLKQSIHDMIHQAPPSPYGVIGIGIGFPGIVDDKGSVRMAPNLQWSETDLYSLLTEEFERPVTIDNEANAGAMGEKRFGAGRTFSDVVYVSIGIGIGIGIVINGELYRGSSGFSGEMGHMTVEANGRPCRCGNQGCWELYASENALLEQAKALALSGLSGKDCDQALDLDSLVQAAGQQNPEVIRLFGQIGESIGIGLSNIVNTFNPELVIIGNRMTIAQPWIKPSMLDTFNERVLPVHRHRTAIEFSCLGTHSAVLGASHFAVSDFFARLNVKVN